MIKLFLALMLVCSNVFADFSLEPYKDRGFFYSAATTPAKALVIFMHAVGGDGDLYNPTNGDYRHFKELTLHLNSQGVAVVGARGSVLVPKEVPVPVTGMRGWNANTEYGTISSITCCSQIITSIMNVPTVKYTPRPSQDDVGYMQSLITDSAKALGIPTSKVVVAGISNGGIMAYRLQCSLPTGSVGAIVAVVGALTPPTLCNNSAAKYFAAINGSIDTTVPLNGGDTQLSMTPQYNFPLSAKESFNRVAAAAKCSTNCMTVDSVPAYPTRFPKSPIIDVTKVYHNWTNYTPICPPDKEFHYVEFEQVGHGSPDMLSLGTLWAVSKVLQ